MSNLKQDIVNELHTPARRNYPRRRVEMKCIDNHWQADLVELGAYAKSNKNHKFLLTVIDCFSKFAFAKPVKDKSATSVAAAMLSIFNDSGRYPKNLQTDHGREFYNVRFGALMKKYGINHYSTFSHMKVCLLIICNRMLMFKSYFSYCVALRRQSLSALIGH